MNVTVESRGNASAAWRKGIKHKFYEDRFRILSSDIPLVKEQGRGELFGVFDGIGSAPKGRQAAQEMADRLLDFFMQTKKFGASSEALETLLLEGNESIHRWGFLDGTDIPQGGCAGTVAWLSHENLSVFHAGETSAVFIQNRGNTVQLIRDHQTENGAIYRYFGLGPILRVEKASFPVEDLDRVLLLTDGVTKVIHPLEAAKTVKRHDDIGRAAKTLAQQAFQKGSIDDITVLLIEIEDL